MGKFSDKINEYYNKPGKGVKAPPPEQGPKAYLFILKTHFFKLIKLNLIFVLFCIPIVTIPAAIVAQNRVLLNLVRKGHTDTFLDFWDAFKEDFLLSFFVGLVYGVFGFLVYFLSVNIANLFEDFFSAYGLAMLIVFFAIFFVMASYSFTLIAIVNLSFIAVFKNSIVFFFVEIKRNLILIGVALLQFFVFMLMPQSVPVLVFVLFAFTQLIVCVCVNEAIQKCVIDPHYKKAENQEKEIKNIEDTKAESNIEVR